MKSKYLEESKIEELEKKLGYKFKNKKYLVNALMHSSFANENGESSYERLEFLGDSILEFVSSKYLFDVFKDKNEGYLTKLRAQVVCKTSLASLARSKFGLQDYILLGKSQVILNGNNNDSVLEDVVEAIIAAILLDGGFENSKEFILRLLKDRIKEEAEYVGKKDFKSSLQEYLQKNDSNVKIDYKIIDEKRPDHDKEFTCVLLINDEMISQAVGKSKKIAEMICAKTALEKYGSN